MATSNKYGMNSQTMNKLGNAVARKIPFPVSITLIQLSSEKRDTRELLSSGWIPRSVRKNTNFRARGRGRGNGGNWNGRGCENGVNKEGGSGGGATYAAFVFTKQQQQSQAVATSFFAGSFSSRNQSSGGWNGGNNGWVGPIETRSLWNNAPIPSTTPFLGGTMSRTSR
ncbi:hypothetical protein M9H77_19056 [Catharanthus roseus]|uniref:Uncharacterized protein n=1 Tax=Catharanthus roseus TaxID=4058 RepID=A0ACC0B9I1_CATRO|nr:hypothetical protein M9H77_19056 [Catharanthus roseus]